MSKLENDSIRKRGHDKDNELEKKNLDRSTSFEELLTIKKEPGLEKTSLESSESPRLPPISKKIQEDSEEPLIPKILGLYNSFNNITVKFFSYHYY